MMKDHDEELPSSVGLDIGHKVRAKGKHGTIHDVNTDGHRMYHVHFEDGTKEWVPHDQVKGSE